MLIFTLRSIGSIPWIDILDFGLVSLLVDFRDRGEFFLLGHGLGLLSTRRVGPRV